MLKKVTLIYVDSGGGHRAAANALREMIGRQRRPWDVEMVCIQEIFNGIDFIRKCTGIPFQDVYNIILRKGWTLGSAQMIRAMHFVMRLCYPSQVKALQRHWNQSQPDLVVSLIPHFNRAIRESLEFARPGVPLVTVLTDIADYPPHFWLEPESDYAICGSERAEKQAHYIGLKPDHVFRASGMILNPLFYEPLRLDREAERERRGLQRNLATGLVLFGGEGSDEMVRIAQALNQAGNSIQLIFLCGKNEAVAGALRMMDRQIPMLVEGFTREIPLYMELADFFIGKPGPGSISEALAKRLPVIVQKNSWTLAHERYNADWVSEQGVGIVVRNFRKEIGPAVKTLLAPENYSQFRRQAAGMRNMAIYEIPDMLATIVGERSLGEPDNQSNAESQRFPAPLALTS